MNDTTNIAWRFTTVVPFDCGDDVGVCCGHADEYEYEDNDDDDDEWCLLSRLLIHVYRPHL